MKISFEATGLPNDGIIVCQSPVENWGWHAENKKENNTYSFNIKALKLDAIKENKITLKIVPGSSDTSLDGQNIKLTFNNLKVVYEEYVDNGVIAENTEAFEEAYSGFEYKFPEPVDISEKSKIVIEVEFLDADKNLIKADWGLGQTLVLPEGYSTWEDKLMEQYNLGMQDVDLTKVIDKTKKVAALAFQNSKEDVKWINIKNITFE